MKRIILLPIILLCLSSLSAASQTLYYQDSYEYSQIRLLAQASGTVGPSTAVPITESELEAAFNRISPENLPERLRNTYYELSSTFTKMDDKKFAFSYPLLFSPMFFLSSDEGENRESFFLSYKDEKPLISIGIKAWFADNIFIESALPITNAPSENSIPFANFSFLMGMDSGIFRSMPLYARGSIGNDFVSLVIGRTRQGMGSGISGNLLLGDNFTYQEFFSLKLISDPFTYNISITHFDNQDENGSMLEASFSGKQQTRVVHRFDVNFLGKVRAVMNFSTLFYSNNSFDLRWLIPFNIQHSYYNYSENPIIAGNDEANNLLSLELELSIAKNLFASFQMALDQFMLPNEKEKPVSVPNAFGFLANISYLLPTESSDHTFFAEAVYTMPYLYINPKYNSDNNPNYNYDYQLGYYQREALSDIQYSGYTYGPDAIVGLLGYEYDNHELAVKTRTTLTCIVKGESSPEKAYSDNEFYSPDRNNTTPTGIPQLSIKLKEELNYKLGIAEFFFGAEVSFIFNYEHEKGEFKNLFQSYAGVTLAY